MKLNQDEPCFERFEQRKPGDNIKKPPLKPDGTNQIPDPDLVFETRT